MVLARYSLNMDATTLVNIGLLIVTAIGASFTAWQALDARHARNEAQTARDAAKGYEAAALRASENSAAAATRAADALDERNEIERSKLPTEPWALTSAGNKHELRNITKDVLYAVYVNELGEGSDITLFDDADDGRDVGPGESIFFDYSRTLSSPASTTLQATWGDPATGERSEWRRTLS